jgi:hypothetical protein
MKNMLMNSINETVELSILPNVIKDHKYLRRHKKTWTEDEEN